MEDTSKSLVARASCFAASALALAFLFNASDCYAFKQGIHEDITEQELMGSGFDEDSADEVGDSSYWTDAFEASNEAAHVDNNRLDLGSQRLVSKKSAVVEALKSCRRRDALDSLGEALHTVQDVFAHSNAVDNNIPVSLLTMQRGSAWCDAEANFAPDGLVSGYFSMSGYLTGDQCSDVLPGQCCHRDLNKDDAGVPNGANYLRANISARDATLDYVQMVVDDLYASVSVDQASQLETMLKKRQRTLSFVIDDTGSMSNDIAGVRSAALGVLDGVVAAGEAPTLGLVTFKDSVRDYGEFCDIDTFRSQISSLYASGGGDCPEASNSALLASLSNFPLINTDMQLRGGRILLATDASAGDYMLGPLVAAQAAIRGVGIDAILTGDCYAEESASTMRALSIPSPSFIPSDNKDPEVTKLAATAFAVTPTASDPLASYSARTQLKALTAQTGGVLFNVARVEVDDVVPTLMELGAPDTAVIRSWRIRSTMGAAGDIEIPVDETFDKQISFIVTASTASALPTFTLLDSAGNVVDATTPGVTRLSLSSVDKYTVSNPIPGTWRVRFDNPGDFIIRAFGQSSLQTADMRLLDSSVAPLTPDLDIMPLEGQPAIGKEMGVDLAMTSTAGSVDAMVLRREDGTPLVSLTPTEVRSGHYRVSFVPPDEPFLMEVVGRSAGGMAYLRQTPVPVHPQSVAMRVNPKMTSAMVGTAADINVTVTNTADTDVVYSLTAISDASWSIELPATVNVAAGDSSTVTLRVWVPTDALEGASTSVVLMAQDSANALVRNSASVKVRATVNQPPVCAGAQASQPLLWPPKRFRFRGNSHFHQNDDMVAESIIGVVDPDGDEVGITITAITQDEPVTRPHGDHTSPDGSGIGTAEAAVRSERDPHRDGRVYAIHFDANDGNGGNCSGAVNVSVPHDQRHPAVDSGQDYDSTQR